MGTRVRTNSDCKRPGRARQAESAPARGPSGRPLRCERLHEPRAFRDERFALFRGATLRVAAHGHALRRAAVFAGFAVRLRLLVPVGIDRAVRARQHAIAIATAAMAHIDVRSARCGWWRCHGDARRWLERQRTADVRRGGRIVARTARTEEQSEAREREQRTRRNAQRSHAASAAQCPGSSRRPSEISGLEPSITTLRVM